MRFLGLIAACVAALTAACTTPAVVNTGESPAAPEPTASPPPPGPSTNFHLVDAFDYVAHVDGKAAYYFTTPSGRWRCAIIPRERAGCESGGGSSLGVAGEPDAANAIVIDRVGDAHFASLEQPQFTLAAGPANVLPFNKVLAAAGFRCNVQETAGVSCLSELTGKGFTFSAEGLTPQYTDVPAP